MIEDNHITEPHIIDEQEHVRLESLEYLTQKELDTLPAPVLDLKYAFRHFTTSKDTFMDKYISPPRGYLFGEDVV